MFLRCVDQKFCQFWAFVEDMDALEHVTRIKLIGLARERKLLLNEFLESVWKLPVDDLIEFVGVRE